MNQCAECNRAFEPRQPYHKLCDDCYARLQGWDSQFQRSAETAKRREPSPHPRRPKGVPWHPRWDWMLGDRLIIWILLIALPAIVIYAIGCDP